MSIAVDTRSWPQPSHPAVDARTDITGPSDVDSLVRNFYRAAAMDDVLGPVFEAAQVNWYSHVETLIEFWSWQLFGESRYVEGLPVRSLVRAHESVHARTPLTSAHFARWVELFMETIDEVFAGPQTDAAKSRGRKMAAAMERLMAAGGGDSEMVVPS